MLRLNRRNRNRNMKNKHSKTLEKNTQEKSKYQEDFNEIILNDLVPEERKKEFGLDNEEVKPKKQGGLKLNLSLGGNKSKKRPIKKQKNNQSQDIKEHDSQEELEIVHSNKKQEQNNIEETSKPKKSPRPKKTTNNKKTSKNNQKVQDNKGSKSKKTNNKNENSSKEKNINKKGKKKNSSSENSSNKVPQKHNNKLNKLQQTEEQFVNDIEENTKSKNQKIINPKKKKREQKEDINEDLRYIEEVEPEIEKSFEDDDNQDTISFRSSEEVEESNDQESAQPKAAEVKEIQSKFENLVWSEDKFPKK